MLVAGEASGDVLGGRLAQVLRARLGDDGVRFVGVGGEAMAREGLRSAFDIAETSVAGLIEGLAAYRRIVRRADEVARLAVVEKPDIAILIDSWGFTLRVARRLRRQNPALPLLKYVGPQVWAMRPGRAKTLARTVDRLLAIHSFDVPYFEAAGLPTTFVGNSSLALDFSGADPLRLRRAIGAGSDEPILLVLLGSRPGEIERLSSPFEDAVRRLVADRPNLRVVAPAAETVADLVRAKLATWRTRVDVVEGQTLKFDAMKAATVAIACSGTVTTELAMAGCPMVVGYRLAEVTYRVAWALLQQDYITLINIAAGEAVAPELLQHDCTGPKIAGAAGQLLDDPARRSRQIASQNAALTKMGRGGPDPAERAADVVIEMLRKRGRPV
jgi:lipid-A-disaccharide synthase